MSTSTHSERSAGPIVAYGLHRRGVHPAEIRLEDIKAAIEALTASYRNPNTSLRFRTNGGWVFLSGEVDWHYQKMEIELAVSRAPGVRGLTSDLVILGVPEPSRRSPARSLKRAPHIQSLAL